MRLYIIGNGFDLNHSMKTSYGNYRDFLLDNNSDIVQRYESSEYLVADSWPRKMKWSDLERNLEIISEECLAYLAENYYPDLTSERTPGWEDIAIEVNNIFSFIEPFTKDFLYKWIESVNVPDNICTRKNIDITARFVTFNYTKTLENIYGIPDEQILHIHGCVDELSSIQFGTPKNNPNSISAILERAYSCDEFYSVVYDPAIQNILMSAMNAYKNLQDNFYMLQNFLTQCESKFDEVIIMGHSYCGIDEPYYEKIFVPMLGNIKWNIYTHDSEDEKFAKYFITKYKLKYAQLIKW